MRVLFLVDFAFFKEKIALFGAFYQNTRSEALQSFAIFGKTSKVFRLLSKQSLSRLKRKPARL
jgi:hypothetical protein